MLWNRLVKPLLCQLKCTVTILNDPYEILLNNAILNPKVQNISPTVDLAPEFINRTEPYRL